ncbi:MAG: YciI family protein [Xenophilus sp.]
MFTVLLRLTGRRADAPRWMDAHNAWLRQGFEDGVFLLSGSLQPQRGGAILAHGTSREALQQRVDADPFVAQGIAEAEILEIAPARTDARLDFLRA